MYVKVLNRQVASWITVGVRYYDVEIMTACNYILYAFYYPKCCTYKSTWHKVHGTPSRCISMVSGQNYQLPVFPVMHVFVFLERVLVRVSVRAGILLLQSQAF